MWTLVSLQHGFRRRIGLLQLDAPVFEFLQRNRHAGHCASHERARTNDAKIAVEKEIRISDGYLFEVNVAVQGAPYDLLLGPGLRNTTGERRSNYVMPASAVLATSDGLKLFRPEKADKEKTINFSAEQPLEVDIEKRSGTAKGNVVITQGTITIKADRIDFKQPFGRSRAVVVA